MKEVLSFMKYYAKLHNIKLIYRKDYLNMHEMSGAAFIDDRAILVFNNDDHEEALLSIFFHECMHIKCFDLGIFPLYHCIKSQNSKSKKVKAKVRSQVFRAELKVDYMAKEEMKNWFPDLKYSGYYISNKAYAKKDLLEVWR